MDPFWIFTAFLFGFGATRMALPPLVGYLAAGFFLHALGAESGDTIERISELGVLLLLFSIGLKLKLKTLVRPEIWLGASLHLLLAVCGFGLVILWLAAAAFSALAGLDPGTILTIAFACSFSSTVFAVKILEERGEMTSLHGRMAIGILIMQDIFAVLFMTVSTGKPPSIWALTVIPALFVLRPILMAILDRVGHRELVLLFGVFMVLGLGAGGFERVGLKPDLGALILGVLVSTHSKADELSRALLSFKDLFLVGFFLNLGLSGLPTLNMIAVALLLQLLLLPKAALYFLVLTRFRLRARTSLLSALALFNYSEFGLIVATVGAKSGWLDTEWSITLAVAVAVSFLVASALNKAPHTLYARYGHKLKRFETAERLPEEEPIGTGDAQVLIFGMGRVGTGAYDTLRRQYGEKILGIDHDAATVAEHRNSGRNTICNDATDPEFWEKIRPGAKVKIVMLCLPQHAANLYALRRIVGSDYAGMIAATAKYEDEMEDLKAGGAHFVFNFFAEAGAGFAEEVQRVAKI